MNRVGQGTVHLTAVTWRQNVLLFVFLGEPLSQMFSPGGWSVKVNLLCINQNCGASRSLNINLL